MALVIRGSVQRCVWRNVNVDVLYSNSFWKRGPMCAMRGSVEAEVEAGCACELVETFGVVESATTYFCCNTILSGSQSLCKQELLSVVYNQLICDREECSSWSTTFTTSTRLTILPR